jgi:outer membrane receptor protein involved in Fe transport
MKLCLAIRAILAGSIALAFPITDRAAEPDPVDAVVITGRGLDLTGVADSANEGFVGALDLQARPIFRVGELVETIPGVIVTQHAGGGKANQFYLRGFNLDHGTDLATSVDGMPVNMVTHAHGQGYTDLNILIPELVDNVSFKKGPYYAEVGDFGSAGAFDIRFTDQLDQGILSVGGGTLGYARLMFADSPKVGAGRLLYGLELEHTDGPWQRPDDYQKLNALLRYSQGDGLNGFRLTLMGYHGTWNSSDQVARRAFDRGLGRFDSLDDTTGGDSQRYSLLADWHHGDEHTMTKLLVYGSYYDLDLFSDFTYFLDDPVRGDQFEQKDQRIIAGAKLSRTWFHDVLDRPSETTLGLQARYDNIRNGLFHTQNTNRLGTVREDRTIETSVGLYAENKFKWTDWFRTVAGVRGDFASFDVNNEAGANSGDKNAVIASPKLSLIFGPWARTELYLNGGFGFHSNDARGVTASTDASGPLVRTKGAEVGVRTTAVPGLQSSLSLWLLDIDSELVFAGDAGTTEPSRPSRRYGIEFANFYSPAKWLTFEADFALSHARFTEDAPEGNHIPGSIQAVLSTGVSVRDLWGGFFGGARVRYFGPRDLIEDGSAKSDDSTLVYLQAGWQFNKTWSVQADVFNLFDSEVSDVDYYYTSRLRGEPDEGIDDYHTHPAEPRSVRFTVTARF